MVDEDSKPHMAGKLSMQLLRVQARAGNRDAACRAGLQAFREHASWAGLQLLLDSACSSQVCAEDHKTLQTATQHTPAFQKATHKPTALTGQYITV